MPRRDKTDIPFGSPEPTAAEPAQQQTEPGGIFSRLKDKVEEKVEDHRRRQVHQLSDGRLCSHTTFELIQQGHEFLGFEGRVDILESASGSLERWRRHDKHLDGRIAIVPMNRLRIVAREFTRLPKGDGRPYDQIFMISGSQVECVGHKASLNLMARLAAFGNVEPEQQA